MPIALLLAIQYSPGTVQRSILDYEHCLLEHAVRLGQDRGDRPEIIARLVEAQCGVEWQQLEGLYVRTIGDAVKIKSLRRDFENEAIRTVMKQRKAEGDNPMGWQRR